MSRLARLTASQHRSFYLLFCSRFLWAKANFIMKWKMNSHIVAASYTKQKVRNKQRLHAQWLRIVCARMRKHRQLLTVSEECVWAETHGDTPHRSALFTYQVQSLSGNSQFPHICFHASGTISVKTTGFYQFDIKPWTSHVSECPFKRKLKNEISLQS